MILERIDGWAWCYEEDRVVPDDHLPECEAVHALLYRASPIEETDDG